MLHMGILQQREQRVNDIECVLVPFSHLRFCHLSLILKSVSCRDCRRERNAKGLGQRAIPCPRA